MPAVIDYRRCTGCKTCYNHCPLDVFAWDEEIKMPKVAYPEECWHCGICWMECPKRAIDITLPASLW
jgi:NAD-dependent dihydropyrimidine dehydrogenase PreA subunit